MKHTVAVAGNPLIARFTDDLTLINPEQGERVLSLLDSLTKHPDYIKLTSSKPAKDKAQEDDSDDTVTDDDDNFWPQAGSWLCQFRPYNVKDGILTIPVKGVLLSGFPYQLYAYATGYEYISKAFERGLGDAAVKGIALDIDSPGGEVKGNFDLVDQMWRGAKEKSVRSFANDYAYSAAYSIASVGDKIIVGRTGGVGSIGVVTSHMDMSKYLEDIGLKITFIYAGKHKVEGNSYQPLTAAAKERIQARIDKLYTVFCQTVARNRGMDEKEIRATEALTYSADDSIEVGLADAIGPMQQARAEFAAELNNANQGLGTMATFSQEQYDKAVADAAAKATADATASATAAATAAATKAARDRMSGILALDEAKDRPKAAMALVTDSEMSVESAKTFLAKLPKETVEAVKPPVDPQGKQEPTNDKAKGDNHFKNAMDNSDHPNLGTTGGDKNGGNSDDERASDVAGILAAQGMVHGKKPEKKAA